MRAWPKHHLHRDVDTNDNKNILHLAMMSPHLNDPYGITVCWYLICVNAFGTCLLTWSPSQTEQNLMMIPVLTDDLHVVRVGKAVIASV